MNFQDMDALGGLIAGNTARMNEDTTVLSQQKSLADLLKSQQEMKQAEAMNPLKLEEARNRNVLSQAQVGQINQGVEESKQRLSRENAAKFIGDMVQFGDTPGAEDYLANKYGVQGHPILGAFKAAKKRGEDAAMLSDQNDPLMYVRQLQEKIALADDKSRQQTQRDDAAYKRGEQTATAAAEREAERTRRAIMVAQIAQRTQQKVAELRAEAAKTGNKSLNQYASELMEAAFAAQASGQPELAQQKLAEANMVTDSLERIAGARDEAKRQAEAQTLYKLTQGKVDVRGDSQIPAKPTSLPGPGGIPTAAIQALHANRQRAAEFDAKFGAGSADMILGNQPRPNSGYRDVRERPMSDEAYQSQEPQIRSHLQRPVTEPPALEAILKAEGKGKNPNSSATGTGQFIDSTMLAKYRQWYPERAQGMSDREILAQRQDDDLMREMTARYMQENAAGLQKAGYSPTGGNIYLAHHFGLDGAKRILKASWGNAVSEVLDDDVIRSNPHLRNMSIRQLIEWAHKKAQGS